MSDDTGGPAPTEYGRQVGARLRAVRRQRKLSLHDVESLSAQEFKASVLGAYERGERVISVPRLQRLARLYQVPVDQLLPSGGDGDEEADGALRAGPPPPAEGISFDLARFGGVEDPQLAMVRGYLDRIARRRQDFDGGVLTVRGQDVRAMAALFGTDTAELLRRLDDLQLLSRSPARLARRG